MHSNRCRKRKREIFVGNCRGLSFANLKVDQADLRARADEQDKRIALHEAEISGLKDHVGLREVV